MLHGMGIKWLFNAFAFALNGVTGRVAENSVRASGKP